MKITENKEKDLQRLELLKKAMAIQKEKLEKEKLEIVEKFQAKEEDLLKTMDTSKNVMTIQYFFEEWYELIGQFSKKGGRKK